MTPARLTRPELGMKPAMPQKDAGPRIDPPVSDPSAQGTRPAATAAPEPLDEPPANRSSAQGLRTGGQGRSKEGPPCANSCVASLPSSSAPAALSRVTIAASRCGT